jgi:poly(3-hydroxybutyrate) depolymerase
MLPLLLTAQAATFTDPAGTTTTYDLWHPGSPKPGLLVWFHEDGGERTTRRRTRGWLRQVAADHDLILVAPREPNAGYWWAPNAARNSRWADAFLRHLESTLPFDRDRVVLAGKSGGAGFAAGLPAWLDWRYGGGVVAVCGADIPRVDGSNTVDDPPPLDPPKPAAPPDVRAWFVVGATDELRPLSEAAAVWYADQGVNVTHRLTPRPGHCSFPLARTVTEGIAAVLAR